MGCPCKKKNRTQQPPKPADTSKLSAPKEKQKEGK